MPIISSLLIDIDNFTVTTYRYYVTFIHVYSLSLEVKKKEHLIPSLMCIVLMKETKPTYREVKKIIQSLIYNKTKINIYINKIFSVVSSEEKNI